MLNSDPSFVNISYLIDRYDTLLFDAYGVLVNKEKALPGATQLLHYLNKHKKNFCIITNGSSATTSKTCANYKQKGLQISEHQVITSGSLIKKHLKEKKKNNSKSLIIGNTSACELAKLSGCNVITVSSFLEKQDTDIENIIICNQDGFPFVKTIDTLISYVFKRIDSKNIPNIIVPNPDFMYPINEEAYGITSGAIALLLENAISIKYPFLKFKFNYLGKPYSFIFDEAKSRYSNSKMIMIGDQLITDIKGANTAKIDSALLLTGINTHTESKLPIEIRPKFFIKDLFL